MNRIETAMQKRKSGYNCAEAVLCAFCDKIGIDEKTALNLSEGFGGGIGGMHSVCGAVTGMIMAANLIMGNVDPKNPQATKGESYNRTKRMAEEFLNKNTSIICADLLGDEERPKLRSCDGCIEDAVNILEKFLEEYEK